MKKIITSITIESIGDRYIGQYVAQDVTVESITEFRYEGETWYNIRMSSGVVEEVRGKYVIKITYKSSKANL